MTVQEAWAAFDKAAVNAWEWHEDVENAVRAAMLAAHVAACKERSVSWCRKHGAFRDTDEMRWHDDRCRSLNCRNSRECDFVGGYQDCGANWYCDKAKQIQELG